MPQSSRGRISPRRGFYFRPRLLERPRFRASTQRFDVRTTDGESLAGARIPSIEGRAEGAPTILGFGGNASDAEAMALTLHMLFPHRQWRRRGDRTPARRATRRAVAGHRPD